MKGKGGAPILQLAQEVRRTPTQIMNASRDAVSEALDTGMMVMQHKILTSGTGWVGKGPRATPDGRIDYGVMYDSVSRTSLTLDRVNGKLTPRGTFGWVNRVEDYFTYQEQGFDNTPPMEALKDGREAALQVLRERLGK